MSKTWPLVPLQEIFEKSNNWIDIDPNKTYKQVTVRLWGRGVVLRSEVKGLEIASSKRISVKAKEFIVSRIDARNGAFGLIPDLLDGAVVTNDFPVFKLNTERIVPKYIEWFSKTQDFIQLCNTASEGTTNRVRIKEDKFLASSISLPSLSEQRRIVAKIEELAKKVEEAKGLTWKAIVETKLVLDASIKNLFSKITSRSKIKTIVDINYGEGLRKQERIETGIYDVYGSGGLIGKHDKCITTTPFVIIGRKGSAGEITYSPNGGWVIDTAYYAIPKNNKMLLTKFFFYSLKSIDIKSGTIVTAIPGINRDSIYEKEIAFPSIDKQQRIIKYLDNLQSKIDKLKRFQNETQKELDALMPSILDKAFKGEL